MRKSFVVSALVFCVILFLNHERLVSQTPCINCSSRSGGGSTGATGPTGATGATGAIGAIGAGSGGGINAQTTSYTPVLSDCGKLITMDNSNLMLTLPSPPLSSTCELKIENLNTTDLTVSRNGLLINNAGTSFILHQYQTIMVNTDGTNYFSSVPINATNPLALLLTSSSQTVGSIAIPTFAPPYVTDGTNFWFGSLFVTPPTFLGWSWDNQGASTVIAVNGSLQFTFQTNSGTDALRCYTRALPASTGYTAIVGYMVPMQASGPMVGDGTKILVNYETNSNPIVYQKWTDSTHVSGGATGALTQTNLIPQSGLRWRRIQDSGGARTLSVSTDGVNWVLLNTHSSGDFLTETKFGFCQETNQADNRTAAATIVSLTITTP